MMCFVVPILVSKHKEIVLVGHLSNSIKCVIRAEFLGHFGDQILTFGKSSAAGGMRQF